MPHPRNRPLRLHGSFEPHLRIVPIDRRVKVAPEQAFVFLEHVTEPFVRASQSADMLRRHATHQLAPRFIRILRRRRIGFFERLPPFLDDLSFVPVRRRNQLVPLPNKRHRVLGRFGGGHCFGVQFGSRGVAHDSSIRGWREASRKHQSYQCDSL